MNFILRLKNRMREKDLEKEEERLELLAEAKEQEEKIRKLKEQQKILQNDPKKKRTF